MHEEANHSRYHSSFTDAINGWTDRRSFRYDPKGCIPYLCNGRNPFPPTEVISGTARGPVQSACSTPHSQQLRLSGGERTAYYSLSKRCVLTRGIINDSSAAVKQDDEKSQFLWNKYTKPRSKYALCTERPMQRGSSQSSIRTFGKVNCFSNVFWENCIDMHQGWRYNAPCQHSTAMTGIKLPKASVFRESAFGASRQRFRQLSPASSSMKVLRHE